MAGRKKRRKKIKYRKITFKLSDKQYRSLSNYADARKTTRTKLIKKMLRKFLKGYDMDVPENIEATPNQLDMFDE